MSDAEGFSRDERTQELTGGVTGERAGERAQERAWPPGTFAFSLVVGLGSLAGSAALVTSADSLARAARLMFVFVALACLQSAAYVDALRPWLRGRPVPLRTRLIEPVLVVVALSAFAGGLALAASSICGLLTGVFLPNASASRYARVNNALVHEEATHLGQPQPPAESSSTGRQVPRRLTKVGPVLRETLAEDRDRALAWAAATLVVAVGSGAVGGSIHVVLAVVILGAAAMAWVSRRLRGTWLALRDFEGAGTPPRRAFVILLTDPNPRRSRPLLGVWSEAPVPTDGRLPRPEAVYRCDAARDALISTLGRVVVHEAWLDTGPSTRSRPRWAAADDGVALPQRSSVLGRWYLNSVIGTERPARARPLTIRAPNPTTENATGTVATVISEETPGTGHWARLFAWRLAGLALAGLVFARLG